MIESLHFHRGYSLRLRKSKPLISYGIITDNSKLADFPHNLYIARIGR
jgi:hypothetical protein